jgi:hypothetical protein
VTDRWKQLEELVQSALDCPAERRDAVVAALSDDLALRAEALELAAAHDRAGDFLEHPAEPLPEQDEPTSIGPYRVIRRLGSGGMGDVYLARRDDQEFEREVAVKLLAPGLYGRDFVRRFRAERQILARLDHPNIARLYDGGTYFDGRPYLVMEPIEGAPLHRFCEERRRSLRRGRGAGAHRRRVRRARAAGVSLADGPRHGVPPRRPAAPGDSDVRARAAAPRPGDGPPAVVPPVVRGRPRQGVPRRRRPRRHRTHLSARAEAVDRQPGRGALRDPHDRQLPGR